MNRRFLRVLAAMVVLPIALPACASDPEKGYAFGSGHRTDVTTIAVPIFDNRTFSQGIEAELTDAIVKEIHRVTPYRVTGREAAETVLTGAITSAEIRRLSRQRDSGLLQEAAYDVAVNFEWKSNADGKVLVSRRNFRTAKPFVPSKGAKERLEFGQVSTIDQLAKDIVAELRGSW